MQAPYSNDFIGIYRASNPGGMFRTLLGEPQWVSDSAAYTGSPVGTSHSGNTTVAGEVWLARMYSLRRKFDRPQATPADLLAEIVEQEGLDGLSRVTGMFAVAVWDQRERSLRLIRDPVGCRTMYYARHHESWWFATRLASLQRTPAFTNKISPAAIRDYLTYSFVPGSQTMWQGISELRPGACLRLDELECINYWEPAESVTAWPATLEEGGRALRQLLDTVVRERLPSRRPVGVYLSGGIDSSLVTALAAISATGPVHTYSIHFGLDAPNELEYSALCATQAQTVHHVVGILPEQVRDNLPATMSALDDPIGDPLTVPNLLLGRAAARDCEVILNGEGGDPCFGGPKNQPMVLNALYGHQESLEASYLRTYQKCYADLPRLLRPELAHALQTEHTQATLVGQYLRSDMSSYLDRLMYTNIRVKGSDHILTKVNNLTRAAGVLGLSPLFDRRIVEASFSVPPSFKLAGIEEKAVLKEAVRDIVPGPIVARPKSGMMVPVQRWFKNELRDFAHAVFFGRRSWRSRLGLSDPLPEDVPDLRGDCLIWDYVEREPVREWLCPPGSSEPRAGQKIWLLLSLEFWLRAQQMGRSFAS